jgi:TraL protein
MSERNENALRRIPLKADNPVPIMFWEPVDFIAGISVLGMGIALKMFVFGVIGCCVTLMIASKLRNGAKRGAAQHWFWYMGLNLDTALKRLKLRSWDSDFIA